MALPLDQLTTPLTVDQIKTSIYSTLASVGTNTSNWKPGAVVRTIIAAVAIVMAAFSTLIALVVRGGFLLVARGAWLDLVGVNTFNEARIDATFATGAIILNNNGGGNFVEAAEAVTFGNSRTGKTYRNVAPFTLAPNQQGLSVTIHAVEAGAASSALPGEITLVSSLAAVAVVSPNAITGLDAELDPVYAGRCQAKTGALSPNGARDAYRFVAAGAKRADGSAIGVNRVRVAPPLGDGFVDIYCAGPSGAISGDPSNPATDLGAIQLAIETSCTPMAITPRVHSVAAVAQDVSYEIWLYNNAGLAATDVTGAIAAALSVYFSIFPIGGLLANGLQGFLYRDAVIALIAATQVAGADLPVVHTVINTPAADVPVAANTVLTPGAITGIIHFVAPPGG